MHKLAISSINMDKVISSKRHIDIDVDELKKFTDESTSHKLGDEGEYIWDTHPEYISTIIRQCKNLYSMGDDIISYKVSIYLNALMPSNDVHVIQKAPMNIGSRVVMCIGHREVFNFSVSMRGMCASGQLTCINGDSFQIGPGMAAGIEISFNDSKYAAGPEKKGFRKNNIPKDPCKRYVIVVDGVMSTEALVNQIKDNMNNNHNNNNSSDVDEIVGKNIKTPKDDVKYNE